MIFTVVQFILSKSLINKLVLFEAAHALLVFLISLIAVGLDVFGLLLTGLLVKYMELII